MPMVEVRFEPQQKVVWVRSGATLLQAAVAAGVDIATGCTRGMCGTDVVHVRDGADRLGAPQEHEKGTLERMGLAADYRLSCSAVVVTGPVTVDVDAF